MGLILDACAIIAGERKGRSAAEVLSGILEIVGPEPVALSVVSVIELEHGVWRAKDDAQAAVRQKFMDDLFQAVPVYPLTFEIARRAARIDGESKRQGIVIPFQDLVIGVTALAFNYAVATLNVRHFEMIPGLVVKALGSGDFFPVESQFSVGSFQYGRRSTDLPSPSGTLASIPWIAPRPSTKFLPRRDPTRP
jgi:predicted nucleic acid-binding protein